MKFAIAVPACVCLYGWWFAALRCVKNWEAFCVALIAMAPIFVLSGPIAHDEDDPISPYPAILVMAASLTVIWTIIQTVRRQRAQRRN